MEFTARKYHLITLWHCHGLVQCAAANILITKCLLNKIMSHVSKQENCSKSIITEKNSVSVTEQWS